MIVITKKKKIYIYTMEIITEIMRETLDQFDLRRMLGPIKDKVRIMKYDELEKETLESLFKNAVAIIIFLQIEGEHGPRDHVGHWIALIHHHDHYEHFDSYGIGIDQEVSITHEKQNLIGQLLKSAHKSVLESTRRLQSHRHDMNTCGRWCVARIRMIDLELPRFYNFIEDLNHVSDIAVVSLTMFL